MVIAGIVLVLASIKLFGHFRFGTGFDSALFGNVSWRLANGYDDVSSLTGYPYLPSHISGFLFLFLPVFRIAPRLGLPIVFVAQAISVGLVGWAVWTLSGHFDLSRVSRWTLLVGTLLSPGALLAIRMEINEPTLALGALAMTISTSLRSIRPSRMWWWVVLAACGRIEMATAVLVVGLLLLIAKKKPWGLVATATGGVVLAATVIYLFGGHGEAPSVAAHFAHLGSSPEEVLRTAITKPLVLLQPLESVVMWWAIVFWLLPFGLLVPVLGWRWLLPAMPLAAVAILGVWPHADSYVQHYWYGFLVGGSIAAAAGLKRRPALQALYPVIGLAGLAAAWAVMLPVIGGVNLDGQENSAELRTLVTYVGQTPDDGVTVPALAASHLVDRAKLYIFPRPFGCADRFFGPFKPPNELPRLLAVVGLDIDPASSDRWFADLSRTIDRHYDVKETIGEIRVWELVVPEFIECLPDPAEVAA